MDESWTIKKAEHQRIDAFELWCWRKLLRVPWTARRSNQSILKEISPEYSLEGLMLKVKFQYLGHLMWRTDSLEKTLMLGKIEGRREGDDRGWDGWMASSTQQKWVWVNSGSWWWTGRPSMLRPMGSRGVGHDWATAWNWQPRGCRRQKVWWSWPWALHFSWRDTYIHENSGLWLSDSLQQRLAYGTGSQDVWVYDTPLQTSHFSAGSLFPWPAMRQGCTRRLLFKVHNSWFVMPVRPRELWDGML